MRDAPLQRVFHDVPEGEKLRVRVQFGDALDEAAYEALTEGRHLEHELKGGA
jgi:hypothetical protein